MLDDIFTYGGELLGLIAFALWLWFALRVFPSFETIITRYEDDLRLGGSQPSAEGTVHVGRLNRLAVSVTALSLFFSAVGYAIPD
ncbi:hypothetical protein [Methylobacterium planeticum]|uniref:Uncharacterized protein n=1 Tax=Methylobacterium planeticum TaxID=2615211 RepID=A0A6N6MQB9_9HYPH|nr:hypothetical protein [Methylobacterium planeticum]KAB1072307.1 hypothetical protein F6X51_16505 [Methylobacterium planeticum]